MTEMEPQLSQRLTPIQKIISSQRLTYLPNLYFKLYRNLSALQKQRRQFPLPTVLLPRDTTSHDHLLMQMQERQFIRKQILKYKKAVCYQLAKAAKQEIIKKSLKAQEKYYFQRVSWSQLAESVKTRIKEQSNTIPETMGLLKPQKNKNRQMHIKSQDDIFMDKDQPSIGKEEQENDLFGDILNEKPQIQEQNLVPDSVKQIQNYLKKMIEIDRNDTIKTQRIINRKQCLKKINENLRKRIKLRGHDDHNQRNLNSATVLINNLISQQTEPKIQQSVQILSKIEYLLNTESKSKKRKQENFELKWSQQNVKKFNELNPKFELSKAKFGSNFLSLALSEKDYESAFQKNIQNKLTFPASIKSIPSLSSKFQQKFYYNTKTDPEYQKFISKHNKSALFQKYNKISPHVLQIFDHTGLQNSKNMNIAKLFLTPSGPYSDRIVYKINSNRMLSVSGIPQNMPLSHVQLAELAFYVRKYMGVFGSIWELISSFISTLPSFSTKFLSSEMIQQYCQICHQGNEIQSSLNSIQMLQSKVLPHSVQVGFCNKQFSQNTKVFMIQEEQDKGRQQNENTEAQNVQFDFQNYDKIINEPLSSSQDPAPYAFEQTSKQFDNFYSNIKFPQINQTKSQVTDDISRILSQFQNKEKPVIFEQKDNDKIQWIFDNIHEIIKTQFKTGNPVRKRKHINDKSSELVKILHSLKQKLNTSASAPRPGTTNPPPPRPTPAPSQTPTPTPPDTQKTTKKILPKPDDKDSSTVNPKKESKGNSNQKGGQKRKKNNKDEQK